MADNAAPSAVCSLNSNQSYCDIFDAFLLDNDCSIPLPLVAEDTVISYSGSDPIVEEENICCDNLHLQISPVRECAKVLPVSEHCYAEHSDTEKVTTKSQLKSANGRYHVSSFTNH
jgi:hypothetical protein